MRAHHLSRKMNSQQNGRPGDSSRALFGMVKWFFCRWSSDARGSSSSSRSATASGISTGWRSRWGVVCDTWGMGIFLGEAIYLFSGEHSCCFLWPFLSGFSLKKLGIFCWCEKWTTWCWWCCSWIYTPSPQDAIAGALYSPIKSCWERD